MANYWSRHGQDCLWKSQSEWQRIEINGEITSMVWPTLGSRTAKEQNRTDGTVISAAQCRIWKSEDSVRYKSVASGPRRLLPFSFNFNFSINFQINEYGVLYSLRTERLCCELLRPVYMIQPAVKSVVKPVWQPVECSYTRYSRGSQTGCHTGCSVVQTVGQPAASCKQTSNRLSNRLSNLL